MLLNYCLFGTVASVANDRMKCMRGMLLEGKF